MIDIEKFEKSANEIIANVKKEGMKEYTNRYGDKFTFELNEKGNIDWKGDFEYVRCGFGDNPEDIIMVDPSGGPYIDIGTDMKLFGHKGKVNGFINTDVGYELVLEK